jgi:hypothetical protein
LLKPEPARWAGLVRTGPLGGVARDTRAALGLATDRPVLMSGHQPGFWHAGIAAKWFALRAACARVGAQEAWVVVDHDPGTIERVRVPVRTGNGVGVRWWDVRSGELAAGAGRTERSPACGRGPVAAAAPSNPGVLAGDGARLGVERMVGSLRARAGEVDAARQFALAAADLLAEVCPAPVMVFASTLLATPAGDVILKDMRERPARVREAYNRAVKGLPAARVAPLAEGELPLWRLSPTGRERVFEGDLSRGDGLAPRALLLTAMLRLFVGDLFIHGTGGGATASASGADEQGTGEGYDRITERWLAGDGMEWGGGAALAPSVVASATLTLDLPGMPIDPLLAKARWKAHAARHDPGLLGDLPAATRKAELVRALRSRRTSASERRATYHELHELLAHTRERHATELAAIDQAAAAAGDAAQQQALRRDRTWAFPLHAAEAMRGLRDAVAAAFGEESS